MAGSPDVVTAPRRALAVSRWIEVRTGWSIRRFVRTAHRYGTIEIQAGPDTVTAADPLQLVISVSVLIVHARARGGEQIALLNHRRRLDSIARYFVKVRSAWATLFRAYAVKIVHSAMQQAVRLWRLFT